jgi:hypothetical protein
VNLTNIPLTLTSNLTTPIAPKTCVKWKRSNVFTLVLEVIDNENIIDVMEPMNVTLMEIENCPNNVH